MFITRLLANATNNFPRKWSRRDPFSLAVYHMITAHYLGRIVGNFPLRFEIYRLTCLPEALEPHNETKEKQLMAFD